jgi:hypothetical protein
MPVYSVRKKSSDGIPNRSKFGEQPKKRGSEPMNILILTISIIIVFILLITAFIVSLVIYTGDDR